MVDVTVGGIAGCVHAPLAYPRSFLPVYRRFVEWELGGHTNAVAHGGSGVEETVERHRAASEDQ